MKSNKADGRLYLVNLMSSCHCLPYRLASSLFDSKCLYFLPGLTSIYCAEVAKKSFYIFGNCKANRERRSGCEKKKRKAVLLSQGLETIAAC